ncbi:MAG TPA: CARDB domain-containing protein [Gemmatimonadales bacterium]|nr:CARDB domain-containing protein [Gemmatimonadales bacterium]
MLHLHVSRRAAVLAVIGLGASLWTGCSDRSPDAFTGPSAQRQLAGDRLQEIHAVLAVHKRHSAALLRLPGVVGTAVGLLPNGKPGLKVLLASPEVRGLPSALEGIPVVAQVTGMLVAFSDPTKRQRPAPMGFSVGHPAITAGSIGARVADGSGNVYVLSNNHVLANSNDASIGDAALQPGPYDGGTAPADQIGTLAAFNTIDFSGGDNTIDAAIARSTTSDLGNATPTDDGYGAPSATIFGDANGDHVFDDEAALLGLNVQKYGRTTKLTHGQITGINATVTVCYEVFFGFCIKAARFVDQLVIEPGTFSGGGDSGSLIVTDNDQKNPVALLFAGSSTQTIANRIDLVLNQFGVTVDGGNSPPPNPVTDIAITSVSAPTAVTQGATVNVVVTTKNVGNQNVPTTFDVTLQDATDGVTIGKQSVAGLTAGASTTLTFSWNTTASSFGNHTLSASHTLTDDVPSNNQSTTTVTVNSPSMVIHIGDLDGFASRNGSNWSVTVELTVHDANHAPLNGATVVGHWSQLGQNSNTCTTGDLGGNGTCTVLFPSLKRSVSSVNFTVVSVTMPDRIYDRTLNHDVDGSSNGTTIKVYKP